MPLRSSTNSLNLLLEHHPRMEISGENGTIYHYHIAKTGGTTVVSMLHEQLGQRFKSSETPFPMVRRNFGFSTILPREPHSQLFSFIYDDLGMKRIPINISTTSFALGDALDYRKHIRGYRGSKGHHYANFQTYWLGGKNNDSPLDRTKEALDTIDVVGVTEHLSGFLCLVWHGVLKDKFN